MKGRSSGPSRGLFTKHLLQVLDEISGFDIQFLSQHEAIDTEGPLSKAIVVIISATVELERGLILERVRAGMRGVPALWNVRYILGWGRPKNQTYRLISPSRSRVARRDESFCDLLFRWNNYQDTPAERLGSVHIPTTPTPSDRRTH